jgi:tRNA threonylcarbamoyladenosine biosynthesis protein TsaE
MPGRLTLQITLETRSEEETQRLGELIGARIERALWVCLTGSLGAGKSVFARGLCRGLGVTEDVMSPTFILCERYAGRLPVIHADLYRLDHERDIENLGLFDSDDTGAVVIVEWADRSPRVLDLADVVLHLSVVDAGRRRFAIRYSDPLRALFETLRV